MEEHYEHFFKKNSFYDEIKNWLASLSRFYILIIPKNTFLKSLQSFLFSYGIPHQSSYPCALKQNGIAKRKQNKKKNIYARTLFFDTHVPLSFYVMLFSFHIILSIVWRPPPLFIVISCSLFSLPKTLSILFHRDSLGLLCFHLVPSGYDKILSRHLKCIFLNYSHLQKGCTCSSPKTLRALVFANATFFESSLFYSSTPSESIKKILHLPRSLFFLLHLRCGTSTTTT